MTERVCSIDGCDGKPKGHGLCQRHWHRWKRYGDPLGGGTFRAPRRECMVSGCTIWSKSRGLCARHYSRWRRTGDPLGIAPPRVPPSCSIDGCDSLAKARGWCALHYVRWKEHGDASWMPPQPQNVWPCSVAGCSAVRHSNGYCQKHFTRWKRHGDPSTVKKVRGEGTPDGQCGLEGCGRPHFARSWCMTHYTQWRRADPDYVPRPYLKKQAIFDRDRWTCHLCGDPIDRGESWPSPMMASVDHVVPRAAGGADDPSNLAASHLVCNMRKGDRPLTELARPAER